jgi:dipeptidyl aminopeptidase/acylaminoacyl peptidase
MPTVKKDKIFLYGGSRGAVIASMLATRDPLLAGVILKSGIYDMAAAYQSYPWYNMIKLTMIWEIGLFSEVKMNERSAIQKADQIKAPLLIIHGNEDDRASIADAELFGRFALN